MPEKCVYNFLDIMHGLFSADEPDQSGHHFRGRMARHNSLKFLIIS